MEDDVVLADEVVGLRLRVFPPVAPGLGSSLNLRPLFRGGQVADDGVEPDIDPLAFTNRVVRVRDLDTPLEVPSDGPVLEPLLCESDRHVLDVLAPALAALQPVEESVLELGQQQEVVLGGLHGRGGPGEAAPRSDEIGGIELAPAVVALIASCAVVVTVRAGSLHIAVGEETLGFGVEQLLTGLYVDEAVFGQFREDVLRDVVVVVRSRRGVQVPADGELVPGIEELGVVAVDDLLGRNSFLVRPNGDRGAVHVGSRDHQDLVPGQPVIASEDVGGQVRPGEVSEVA